MAMIIAHRHIFAIFVIKLLCAIRVKQKILIHKFFQKTISVLKINSVILYTHRLLYASVEAQKAQIIRLNMHINFDIIYNYIFRYLLLFITRLKG